MAKFYPTHADMNDDRSDLFRKPSLHDCQDKFIVIKVERAKERLTDEEQDALIALLIKLDNQNEYWVVNKDEPYAKQVRNLIRDAETPNWRETHKALDMGDFM